MTGAARALAVTLLLEVPIAAALFPKQRLRIAGVAFVANTATNLFLNVGLPWLGVRGQTRILVGEIVALALEALAYALLSRPRQPARAVVASGLGNLVSFALGPALAGFLFLSAFLVACGGSPQTDVDGGLDAAADGQVDAPIADATPEADAAPSCAPSDAAPTRSFALADWPTFTAATAPDWTAAANVTSAAMPSAPAGVAVAPGGGWVFTALHTELAVSKRTGAATTLDHAYPDPANEVAFGVALSRDGTTLALSLSDEIALYDVAKTEANGSGALLGYVPTKSVKKTSIDVAFSADGAFAFVALEYDSAVAVVDVGKLAYVGAIPIDGTAVTGVVVSPDGARLYVTTELANAFKAANPSPAPDQVVGMITVVDVPKAEATPATSVLGSAYVGRAPVRSALSPDGATLWVTARGSNALVELDTATLLSTTCNPVRSETAVGPAPVGVTVLDGGKAVAVANSNRFQAPTLPQTVTFVSASSPVLLGQVTVGAFPRELDADATALFVSNFNSQSLSGLDLTKLALP